MLLWLDQHVRLRFVIVCWLALVCAYGLRHYLLFVLNLAPTTTTVVGATISEELLWVVLQPLGVLVYTARNWRQISRGQRAASFFWFWIPAAFLVALFVKKLATLTLYGPTSDPCQRLDVALEFLWIYFPIAGTTSWYLRQWKTASEVQKWRCCKLFFPITGLQYFTYLAKWTAILLFDVSCSGMFITVLNHLLEALWVIQPGLGIWAERYDLKCREHQPLSAISKGVNA